MSLLVSSAFVPGCNVKSRTVSPSLKTPEYETQHSTSSSQELSMFDYVKDTTDENDKIMKRSYLEIPTGLEEKGERPSPPTEDKCLKQEVEELTPFNKKQTHKNCT
ncbi:hypothetical protein VNO77_07370 [Canavalia gladiata]|uniref:Uncharacterized protein n=1 Tax=Canavalia gladiata TaxID=3824 RepID=A0AAN9QW45_CANGL